MAFAAGAAVTIPTLSALGTIAYYAQHPDEAEKRQERRPSSFMAIDSHREFIGDDDPSDFSSFSSAPSILDARITRRKSMPMVPRSESLMPDHSLLEDPQLQVWRDRYKWGRNYGMNFAHNDR
ncbi:hypothetical protein GGI04_004865 [Coemansia thaxteri]|uniref:Uncharacterized protein n=1 Tax=Coemansia thaxteri TaxID=2663907 RepID=A0A9W8BCY7_9FUNG|nr:hypothetical protein GGI04_004865 [Coemansia thaxteri]KAJ2001068.1 hypothetical protein H4R26_004321 [Coemansia thaxteri]KAJ2462973.1 hypothetical protein EV174_007031 [Coemansia sp. RSA 2320]KAJ2471998.1 hypothetical protein GGI02_001894 [Coemansia sp. RSA 2322]